MSFAPPSLASETRCATSVVLSPALRMAAWSVIPKPEPQQRQREGGTIASCCNATPCFRACPSAPSVYLAPLPGSLSTAYCNHLPHGVR